MSQAKGLDPLQMLMEAADQLGNAAVRGLGSLLGAAVQHAPGAIGATVNAGAELASGVVSAAGDLNTAVREATSGIASPSQGCSPFAGLNLSGVNMAALRGCSIDEPGAEQRGQLGELNTQFANMAQTRVRETSMQL